jgi:hypothetical protein
VEAEHEAATVPPPAARGGTHQCCCVIRWLGGGGGEKQCPSYYLPADVPFCDMCASRHPSMRSDPDLEITQRFPEASSG